MKRLRMAAIAAAILLFAGCAARADTAPPPMPADMAARIRDRVEFTDELMEADEAVADELYRLNGRAKDFSIYISGTGATAQEVAVLDCGVDVAEEVFRYRLEDLALRFEDYLPGEMMKINDPVMVVEEGCAVLVLCDNPDDAREAVEKIKQGR